MEKPDADGFINVNWPSTNVQYGGIFHPKIAAPTSEQRDFLKILLEESKLNIALRKKDSSKILPENKKAEKNISRQSARPHTSRRRSLSTIRGFEASDDFQYIPQKRGENREKMKERLANIMTYGDDDNQQIIPVSPSFGSKPLPKLPSSKDIKKELINQICERMKWLAEMECLGQAEPHKVIINDQIAERIRALDALGIDSETSSARSTASGFSTIRSREQLQLNKPMSKSPASSVRSLQSKGSATPVQHLSRRNREENVASYSQLPSLQRSPRRRV